MNAFVQTEVIILLQPAPQSQTAWAYNLAVTDIEVDPPIEN